MKNWAPLSLRFGAGVVFLIHGLSKAFGLFGGPGINNFAGMLAGLGFAPAKAFAVIVAYIELLGGLSLILGILMRPSTVLLGIVMLVALLKVHLAYGFFNANSGFEYPFLLLCALSSLFISGPGNLSVAKKK